MIKIRLFILPFLILSAIGTDIFAQKIFNVHIHGDGNATQQLTKLKAAGVYKAALSTSWELQQSYRSTEKLALLQGLMLACPQGKVPYSGQQCFADQKDFPDVKWVEKLIIEKKIDFLGEVLSQYYGVSPSDTLLFPYYALAEKHGLPVGIHTGLGGPDNGSAEFKVALGNPILMEEMLRKFPKLKVWIMHCGAPYLENTMAIMKYYPNVYADISAISNPRIFPPAEFQFIMKRFLDAGFGDRLMFGSDNGDIDEILANFNAVEFLSPLEKQKILYQNAEAFFAKRDR